MALQIVLGEGCSGSLGRSAETGGEAYTPERYLIEIFTADSRPMRLKSFCKFNGLRLQKINCVYSQGKKKREREIDHTSVGTVGRDCCKWVEQFGGAEFFIPSSDTV